MVSDDSSGRVACRIQVDVRCPAVNLQKQCCAYHLGMDRVFLEDVPPLAKGTEVEVRFPGDHKDPLRISCTVEETLGDLAFLRFPDLQGDDRGKLEALICPNWDGVDLLEGLLILSRRLPAANLEDWLRLTSILVKCRPGAITECLSRLDQGIAPDFLKMRE